MTNCGVRPRLHERGSVMLDGTTRIVVIRQRMFHPCGQDECRVCCFERRMILPQPFRFHRSPRIHAGVLQVVSEQKDDTAYS